MFDTDIILVAIVFSIQTFAYTFLVECFELRFNIFVVLNAEHLRVLQQFTTTLVVALPLLLQDLLLDVFRILFFGIIHSMYLIYYIRLHNT